MFDMTPSRAAGVRMRGPRRSLRLALSALAVAALSACSMVPKYERPAAPVEAQYPALAPAAAAGVPSGADLAWREFVGDARLREVAGGVVTGGQIVGYGLDIRAIGADALFGLRDGRLALEQRQAIGCGAVLQPAHDRQR